MPRKRLVAKIRRRRDELTGAQLTELVCSCVGAPRNFANEVERREAWEDWRGNILSHSRPGGRPSAWWAYDSPERPRVVRTGVLSIGKHQYPIAVREHETETLIRLGLATAADVAALRSWVEWRRDVGYTDPDTARQEALLFGIARGDCQGEKVLLQTARAS